MTEATRSSILAVRYFLVLTACYFLAPLVVFIGLVAIGTFTGYLFISNGLISILSLSGFFVGLVLMAVRNLRLKGLMLICSVSLIAIQLWYFREETIQRYLYVAQILATPHFDKKCIPPDGVLLNGDAVRLCSTHDFNLVGWFDFIVKISGPYPKERLIDDMNSGSITPPVADDELIRQGMQLVVYPGHVSGRHLVFDYYLIQNHLCGNGDKRC